MNYYTLSFPDYATARVAAKQLGFWDDESDSLKGSGQSQNPDESWFGWSITEIGQDPIDPQHPGEYDAEGNEVVPPQRLRGYYVNAVGQLPPAALTFLAPGGYGCAGVLYAGSNPAPTLLPAPSDQ
jgi:hypothetical protein